MSSALVLLVLVAAGSLGCSRERPPPPPAAPVDSPSGAPASAAPPLAPVDIPRSGPTPGHVACGGPCAIGKEACCSLSPDPGTVQRQCVPWRPGAEAAELCEVLFGDHRRTSLDVATCDERADCAAGQECCTLPEHPGETTVTACVPKGDCIYARACRVDSECAAGTECRANINECVRGERASCGHTRCVPTLSPVSCDGKPCTPSAPVCLLGDGGPRCTSAGESRDLPRLLCTKPSQCGDGRRCCLERAPSGDRIESATCMDDCLHEAMNVACETDGDCIFAVEKKCKPLAGRPRGIKMCQ